MNNSLDKQYTDLLKTILKYGVVKDDRTGTGTKSIFGYTIRHNMKDGFPLLTTKKMPFKTIVTELLWFLRGDTNIKFLVDNNCHIWDGDAYKNYEKAYEKNSHLDGTGLLWMTKETKETFIYRIKTDNEFAKEWGELGPIYGKQWRNWEYGDEKAIKNGKTYSNGEFMYDIVRPSIDQIQNSINLLKTDPDSRRNIISAWNVGELDQMVLPPCHNFMQFYTRELSLEERCVIGGLNPNKIIGETPFALDSMNVPKRAISLMWNQRSVDTFLGLPFNIASYGLLLEIIAKEVNMVPDQLIGNLGDTHLYLNHIEQAEEQIGRVLTDEERYNIWFNNNYETGMERFFDPNNLPDFEHEYYTPTPKRTREGFTLPKLKIYSDKLDDIAHHEINDFEIIDYKSDPIIKAPLSN